MDEKKGSKKGLTLTICGTFLLLISLGLALTAFYTSTGPRGDVGPKGDTGSIGQDGSNGKDGINGKDGTNGETTYSNTILPTSNGKITCSLGSGVVGSNISFTFTPDVGYTLQAFTLNDDIYVPDSTYVQGSKYVFNTLMIENGYCVDATFVKSKYLLVTEDILDSDNNLVSSISSNKYENIQIGDSLKLSLTTISGYDAMGLLFNDSTLIELDDSRFSKTSSGYDFDFILTSEFISNNGVSVKPVVYKTIDYNKEYSIVIDPTYDGDVSMYEITSNVNKAKVYDSITLNITPTDGYEFNGLVLGNKIVYVTNGGFSKSNGVYSYTFKLDFTILDSEDDSFEIKGLMTKKENPSEPDKYEVKIYTSDDYKGTISIDKSIVGDFETINISLNPTSDYLFDDLVDSNGNSIKESYSIEEYDENNNIIKISLMYSSSLDNLPYYVNWKEKDDTTKLMEKDINEINDIINANLLKDTQTIMNLNHISVTSIFNYYKDTYNIDLFRVFKKTFTSESLYLVFDLTNIEVLINNSMENKDFHSDIYRVISKDNTPSTTYDNITTYDLMTYNMEGFSCVLDDSFTLSAKDVIKTYISLDLGNSIDSEGNNIKQYVRLTYDNSLNYGLTKNIDEHINIDMYYFEGDSSNIFGWNYINSYVSTGDTRSDDENEVKINVLSKDNVSVSDVTISGCFLLNSGSYDNVSVIDDNPYIKVNGASINNLKISSTSFNDNMAMYVYLLSGSINKLSLSHIVDAHMALILEDEFKLNTIDLSGSVGSSTVSVGLEIVPVNDSNNINVVNKLKSYLSDYSLDITTITEDIYNIKVSKK